MYCFLLCWLLGYNPEKVAKLLFVRKRTAPPLAPWPVAVTSFGAQGQTDENPAGLTVKD